MGRRRPLLFGVISVIFLAGAGVIVGIVASSQSHSQSTNLPVSSKIYKVCTGQHSKSSSCGTAVTGETYTICTEPQYLTSPYKYDALASGSQSYTVAEYTSLPGYGTNLPPLPAFIAAQAPKTEAAIIYAPGSTMNVPAYARPGDPGRCNSSRAARTVSSPAQSVSGDEFIGGATAKFPEPTFDDGGRRLAASAPRTIPSTISGGTSALASAAGSGATTLKIEHRHLRLASATFPSPDGATYQIASANGTSLTLSSGLTRSEAAGTQVWANDQPPIATVASGTTQGASSIALTAAAIPLMLNGRIVVGIRHLPDRRGVGDAVGLPVSRCPEPMPPRCPGAPVYYDTAHLVPWPWNT